MMSRSTRLAWPLPVGLLLYVLSDRPAGTLQSAYRGASSSAVSALAFRPRACHKGGRALWCESLAPQSARKRRAPTGSPLFPSGHAVTWCLSSPYWPPSLSSRWLPTRRSVSP